MLEKQLAAKQQNGNPNQYMSNVVAAIKGLEELKEALGAGGGNGEMLPRIVENITKNAMPLFQNYMQQQQQVAGLQPTRLQAEAVRAVNEEEVKQQHEAQLAEEIEVAKAKAEEEKKAKVVDDWTTGEAFSAFPGKNLVESENPAEEDKSEFSAIPGSSTEQE